MDVLIKGFLDDLIGGIKRVELVLGYLKQRSIGFAFPTLLTFLRSSLSTLRLLAGYRRKIIQELLERVPPQAGVG